MRRFAVALIGAAVDARMAGTYAFTTDLVQDESIRPESTGMTGSIVTQLQNAGLLKPVGVMHQGQWLPRRAKSTRPTSHNRWLNLYELTGLELANEFLRRHGAPVRERQPELL